MHRKTINISTAMTGQGLGVNEVEVGIWVVGFRAYDLGYIDLEQKTLQPIDTRSYTGVTHAFGKIRYLCVGPDKMSVGCGGRI